MYVSTIDLMSRRVNLLFGIGDLAFSIGDDSIADFVSSIQFLPVVQMVRARPKDNLLAWPLVHTNETLVTSSYFL